MASPGLSYLAPSQCSRMHCLGRCIMQVFPAVQMVKNPLAMQETWVQSLGWEDPLEKEMATHSSILAWRTPGTEELGGLQPRGSHRVRNN